MTSPARTEITGPAVPGSVIGYCRISDARNGDTDSTDRQAWEIRKLAQREGLPAPRVISEQGSASRHSRKPRPEFRRLCEAMEAGAVSDLLLWHQDRWLRQPKDLERLIDIVEATGVRVHAVHGGRVDLTSAEQRLNARVMGSVAAFESDHRSDRVRAASQQRAERGRSHGGGRRPYGYDVTGMTLIPEEAEIVRELTDRVIASESCRALAADLRARKVPTVTGNDWTAVAIRGLLWRARNAGLREHGGTKTQRGELFDAAWPPCVSRAKWEACCGVLADPARVSSPGNNVTTLLSGIAVCEAGHTIVSGGNRRHGRRTYVCRREDDSRGHITRVAEPVDEAVVVALCGTDTEPGGLLHHHGLGTRRVQATSPIALQQQVDGLHARLDQIEDAFACAEMSRDGFRRNAARLNDQISELQRQIAVVDVPTVLQGLEGITYDQFRGLPLDRQRAVVRELLTVTLHRARPMGSRFDLDSVEINPRGEFLAGWGVTCPAEHGLPNVYRKLDGTLFAAGVARDEDTPVECPECGQS